MKLIVASLGLLAATAGVAEPRRIEAMPYCILNGSVLMIRTIIDTVETPKKEKANDPPFKSRTYWVIDCQMDSGSCIASGLGLRAVENGEPIGPADLTQAAGMRLVSVAGKVATIVWGIRTFTLDMSKRVVSIRISGVTSDGVGSGPCAR
jgi:hypothetical protein